MLRQTVNRQNRIAEKQVQRSAARAILKLRLTDFRATRRPTSLPDQGPTPTIFSRRMNPIKKGTAGRRIISKKIGACPYTGARYEVEFHATKGHRQTRMPA
jgi:hypothetical protein